MSTTRAKLRCFMVRSARDVAAQALPNWAQIAAALTQNFYDVFVDCPDAERGALLEEAERVSASEWASIRAQVASELGERYAEALDQARAAMRQAARASNRSEGLRRGLNETLIGGGAHRDLKPSNVLLSARGEPQLADFGLSKQMSDAGASITTTGAVLGSPAYMSPEAINGERVGLAGDVWSLGGLDL